MIQRNTEGHSRKIHILRIIISFNEYEVLSVFVFIKESSFLFYLILIFLNMLCVSLTISKLAR